MIGARPRLAGIAAAAAGTALVLFLLVAMNRPFSAPEDDGNETAIALQVVKKEEPKPRERIQRREPPKRQPTRTPPAPLVGLDSGLAGLDFGLPAFDASELDLGGGLLGSGDDVVMTDDTVDNPPRAIVQTPMQYPPRAKAQGITGYVILNVLISPTGQVERVTVLEAQPAGVFDDIAAAGVQNWRFEPATYKGENVRVWAKQRVRFDLS